jgi:hypothetical protein
VIEGIVAQVPDGWLGDASVDPPAARAAYVRYLTERRKAPRAFAEEAARAR